MLVCTVCGTVWAAKLNACPGHGCGGALRPVGPAEADHPVLRRFPMARIRGTTATVAPAAAVTVPDDVEVGAGPPRPAPATTTTTAIGPKARARKPTGRR